MPAAGEKFRIEFSCETVRKGRLRVTPTIIYADGREEVLPEWYCQQSKLKGLIRNFLRAYRKEGKAEVVEAPADFRIE